MIKKTLGELCTIEKGKTGIKKAIPGNYPLVVTAENRLSHNEYQFDGQAVCIPLVSSTGHGHASINRLHFESGKFALGSILAAALPKNNKELDCLYLYIYLSVFKDTLIVPLMKGGANVSLTIDKLKTLEIFLPSLEKQHRIVEYFLKLSNFVQRTTIINNDTVNQLNGNFISSFLENFSNRKTTLSKFVVEISETLGKSETNIPKIGVSNTEGIVPLKSSNQQNFSKYKIVNYGDFIYNPMRVNVGSIGLYQGDTPAITSPDYVVFKIINVDNLSPHVLLKYLKSKKGLLEISKNTVGSVRKRLYFENLCNVEIPEIDGEKNKQLNSISQKSNKINALIEMNNLILHDFISIYLNNKLT